jgi:predicted glycosyltransferase
LKEDLYLCRFIPDEYELKGVGKPDQIKVLFRPEGRFAHYRSTQSEILQNAILGYLSEQSNVLVTLLPRDSVQATELSELCVERAISYWIPQHVLDGPSLIWGMDAVIGGGGTMTREAAALGVPAYSFFAGQWGAVDRYLQTQGRLVQVGAEEDVSKILLRQRERTPVSVSSRALDFVNGFIEDVIGR